MKSTASLALLLIYLVSAPLLHAQEAPQDKFLQTITKADLKKHLEILASDEYEGRETGERGQKMAAEYIQKEFESYGLSGISKEKNPYLQSFELEKTKYDGMTIKGKKGNRIELLEDFFSLRGLLTEKAKYEMVFVGYGIDQENYSDYEGVDVKGKIAVLLMGEPKDTTSGNYLISGTEQTSSAAKPNEKLDLALEKGATGVIMLYEQEEVLKSVLKNYAAYFSQPQLGFPSQDNNFALYSAPSLVAPLFGKKQEDFEAFLATLLGRAKNLPADRPTVKVKVMPEANIEKVSSENVLGFMEGTDKKDEVVVITSHYDHIGISPDGQINNGADDDGSGTVAVLEMAQAFSEAYKAGHKPRRSILFMTVSGEEKGLLGSAYYSDNPILPLENTVTNLNIDMIGRVDPKHEDAENPNYVYIIGSNMLSDSLHSLSERIAAEYGEIELDYRYNDKDDPNRFYYRSDHYNFAKHDIPVIFYFNGTHADYHKPTDTVDKIHFEKMEKITRLIFLTGWEIANQEERITADKLQK